MTDKYLMIAGSACLGLSFLAWLLVQTNLVIVGPCASGFGVLALLTTLVFFPVAVCLIAATAVRALWRRCKFRDLSDSVELRLR